MPWRAVSLRISSWTGPGARRGRRRARRPARRGRSRRSRADPPSWAEPQLLDRDRAVVVAADQDALAFVERRDLDAGQAERGPFDQRGVADREAGAPLGELIEQRHDSRGHAFGAAAARILPPQPRHHGVVGKLLAAPRRNHAAVSAARAAGETKTRS